MDITTHYGYFNNYVLGREGKYKRLRKGCGQRKNGKGQSTEGCTMA
jgi:hypothetical protein